MNAKPTAPFKKLQDVYVARHCEGSPYRIGESVLILSVTNNGTRKNPIWRYYVRGAWFYHEDLSAENPCV